MTTLSEPALGRLARRTSRRRITVPDAVYPLLSLAAMVAFWEWWVTSGRIHAFLLPAPSAIVTTIINRWSYLAGHATVTLTEVLLGFGIAIIVGISMATAITYIRPFEKAVYPILVGGQTIPKVAIAPLFILWFGFEMTPKVVIAFLVSFFPIVINTIAGLRAVMPETLYLTRSMGSSFWFIYWKAIFPNALPSVFAGLKIAIVLAVIGAIVGEFVGASAGLGYVIQLANGNIDVKLLFAAIAFLSTFSLTLFFAVVALERKILWWHQSVEQRTIESP